MRPPVDRLPIIFDDHAKVPLSRGLFAIIDLEDVRRVSNHRWYAEPGGHTHYAACGVQTDGVRRRILMHRYILGDPRPDLDVDHVNGNGLDNRRANMRVCTRSQNLGNTRRSSRNKCGIKGVSLERGMYRASIRHEGKRIYLGSFRTAEAASAACATAALHLRGEFARFD